MKICPKCQSRYSDDRAFCEKDGTVLVAAPAKTPFAAPRESAMPPWAVPALVLCGAGVLGLVAYRMGKSNATPIVINVPPPAIPPAAATTGTTTGAPPAVQDSPTTNIKVTPVDYEYVPASELTIVASSSAKDPNTQPSKIYDGLTDTAWCEGDPGNGEGQWIQFKFNRPRKLGHIEVIPGYDKIKADRLGDRWTLNNRPRSAKLYLDSETIDLHFDPNNRNFQSFDLGGRVSSQLKMEFRDVIKGTSRNSSDLCISEVKIYADKG